MWSSAEQVDFQVDLNSESSDSGLEDLQHTPSFSVSTWANSLCLPVVSREERRAILLDEILAGGNEQWFSLQHSKTHSGIVYLCMRFMEKFVETPQLLCVRRIDEGPARGGFELTEAKDYELKKAPVRTMLLDYEGAAVAMHVRTPRGESFYDSQEPRVGPHLDRLADHFCHEVSIFGVEMELSTDV